MGQMKMNESICAMKRNPEGRSFNSQFAFPGPKLPPESRPDDSFESNIDQGRFL
jgi:hypothetical protein